MCPGRVRALIPYIRLGYKTPVDYAYLFSNILNLIRSYKFFCSTCPSCIKHRVTPFCLINGFLFTYSRPDGQRLTHRELRERIERQRSVATPKITTADSLEGLNLEVYNTRSSVDRLDTQVSSLHHDVAALSMEASQTMMSSGTINTMLMLTSFIINDATSKSLLR